MNGTALGIGTALAAVAIGLTAATAGTAEQPAWERALIARGEALNRQYDLGEFDRRSLGSPGPGWREALMARSDALNKEYGLGVYASQTKATGTTPDWLKALVERSDALNREYRLGNYAAR